MAKLECEYFPGSAAAWRCNACATHYGERCIPDGHGPHWGRMGPRCIRCGGTVQFLGTATDAKPFWQMLPSFFAYALHPNCLLVIALMIVLSLIIGAPLISLFAGLFAMAVVLKYGFAIIEQYGRGRASAPAVSAVLAGDEHHLFLRQIGVFIGMGVAVFAAAQVSLVLSLLVQVFFTLAIPASTIILAVEKSVRRALSPVALLAMMRAIGWPYLLLWFCSQLISAGPTYIVGALSDVLPAATVMPIIAVLMTYFAIVLYAMLGYVLFEYQHELGFDSRADATAMNARDFEKARAMGEATVLLREGELDRARKVLRRGLDIAKDDIELHLHYHKLLLLLQDKEALANHCNYLTELCARNRCLNRAVSVLLDTQRQIPDFLLDDSQLTLELARLLQLQGQQRAALQLLEEFQKRMPCDPGMPAACLQLANILFEHYNQDRKAAEYAQYALTHYPSCPERVQLDKLLTVINQTSLVGI